MSSSSSRSTSAIRPALRRLVNSESAVRLMMPFLVAITRKCPATFSAGTGSMAVTFSPPSSCSRLTMAVPRAVRPASGIW